MLPLAFGCWLFGLAPAPTMTLPVARVLLADSWGAPSSTRLLAEFLEAVIQISRSVQEARG